MVVCTWNTSCFFVVVVVFGVGFFFLVKEMSSRPSEHGECGSYQKAENSHCLWDSQGKESSTYLKMYLFIFYQKDQHLIRPACCLLAVETAFQTGQNLQGTFCREMAPEMPAQVRESPGNVCQVLTLWINLRSTLSYALVRISLNFIKNTK